MTPTSGLTLWGVGHSTHTHDQFVALLRAHEIGALADIRTVPKSRRHPHFHTEVLARSLPDQNIAYVHLPRLGGFRRPRTDSPNAGWRNASFRGYADYAMTAEFAAGLIELRHIARAQATVMMCSEALWWRCHRRLVADRLVASGGIVLHIGSDQRCSTHELSRFALVDDDGQITYPTSAAR